ncbi:MAG: DNA mismatch repair protein MutS, partial [Candidatus Thorarchaeota archaeon]
HKVVDGGTDKSYGVHVAALAGVPEPVIQRAREILSRLESQNNVVLSEATGEPEESMQTTLEALTVEDPIVERIRHMDLDRTTPIEALLALKEMQEEIKRRN